MNEDNDRRPLDQADESTPALSSEPPNAAATETSTPPVTEAATATEETTTSAHDGVQSLNDDYKLFGIIGYLVPFLFFLPLIRDDMKDVPYIRFHVNQQLILLVVSAIVWFVGGYFLMIFGYLGMLVMRLLQLAFLVLAIIGVINVAKGEQKELPIIGGFTLMK